ncbi:hypothetical protein AVEN_265352-1 [Araneus ventricosus]|uniref:Uncharacterized protein n=1 Tax=Araneus ventricosus TaxID=182803 RepID=A0A4Y2SX66_ARAVE|nr:hypothetical protein AVEN_96755-1 [Araneus ventricosus]GBN93330.1 hypothetical protein AVEN_265352-1 [Araneus ventricosus]
MENNPRMNIPCLLFSPPNQTVPRESNSGGQSVCPSSATCDKPLRLEVGSPASFEPLTPTFCRFISILFSPNITVYQTPFLTLPVCRCIYPTGTSDPSFSRIRSCGGVPVCVSPIDLHPPARKDTGVRVFCGQKQRTERAADCCCGAAGGFHPTPDLCMDCELDRCVISTPRMLR